MKKQWIKLFTGEGRLKKLRQVLSLILLSLIANINLLFANVYSQSVNFNLNLKNATLGQVFDAVRKQSEFEFFYSNDQVNVNKKIDINVRNASIDEVLGVALDKQYDYKIEDRYILISKNENPKEISTQQNVKQQPSNLTGIIKDNTGSPVVGASVVVKGSSVGTASDLNGKYSLQVPENATLVISYIGYKPQEVKVGNRTQVDVTLHEDDQLISEVVVVGFGTQKKANLTGAVSSVNMDQTLGNRPVTTIQGALQGAVPGLQVTNSSGAPGSDFTMNIRGIATVSPNPDQPRDSSPLVLMDNIPVDLNMVNPEDIESVSVLKDAAATAIYGARAAFGVVLITSKKGTKNQKAHFSYSNNLAFTRPSNLPEKVTPLQQVQFLKDAGCVDYIAAGQNIDTWIGLLNQYNADPSQFPNGYYMSDRGIRYDLKANDQFKDMTETGFQQIHNLSVTGGSENINYRLSFGYNDQDGVLVTNKDSYDRLTTTGFVNSDVTKWLSLQLETSYVKSKSTDPYTLSFNGGNFWTTAANYAPYTPTDGMDVNGKSYLFATPRNIMNMTTDPATSRVDNTRLTGRMILKPFKGMTVNGEYSYNYNTIRNERFIPQVTMVNPQIYALTTNVVPASSTYTKQDKFQSHNTLNVYGTYVFDIHKEHNFSVMGGFNQESDSYEMLLGRNSAMITDQLPSIQGGTGTLYANDNYSEYAVRGLFYRVNYDYKSKYLFEANGRYDGSSRFPKDSRFGFFPSFSGAWRVTEESFMEGAKDVLSNLKLRASWGNIGNQGIPPYEYLAVMSPNLGIWSTDGLTRVRYLDVPRAVSGNFTWETVQTLNFGVDLGFFNNRLATSFDIYDRKTKGMLGPETYPLTFGVPTFKLPYSNSSDMDCKGWELQVSWNDSKGDFKYGVGFNLSDAQSEITRYNNPSKVLTGTAPDGSSMDLFYPGKKLGEIWGYVFDRYYTIDDFVAGTVDPTTMKGNGTLVPGVAKRKGYSPNPGDILYKYANADGIIDNGDNTANNPGAQRVIGNTTPRYMFGINLNGGWKNFDVSVFLQGVAKRDLPYRSDALVVPFGGSSWNTMYTHELDYWRPDNQNAEYARYYYNGGSDNFSQKVDKYLLNGAYMRLKNITLTYTFSKELVSKWGLNGLKIFFSGENLYTWDKLPKGIDPENAVGPTQIDPNSTNVNPTISTGGAFYPLMRTLSFGINVGI